MLQALRHFCCMLHATAACCMLHAVAACCKSCHRGMLHAHRAQCHASAQTFTLCRKSARHSPALAGAGRVATQCTPVRALQHVPLRLAARCRMLSSGRSSPHMLSPRELAAADAEVGRALIMPQASLQARPRRQLCFHTPLHRAVLSCNMPYYCYNTLYYVATCPDGVALCPSKLRDESGTAQRRMHVWRQRWQL